MSDTERVTLTITGAAPLTSAGPSYFVTMLVGDGTYNGCFYPAEEIVAAAGTMLGRPVNLDHSSKVEDVVGTVTHAYAEAGTLKGVITLSPSAPKFAIAKAHLDGQLALGATPNVSIEVLARKVMETVGGTQRLTARGFDFAALALVQVGACDDKDGCGVHTARNSEKELISMPTPEEIAASEAAAKDKLCAKDIALNALKEQTTELQTKLSAAEARATKAETDLAAVKLEAERGPLVAELAKRAPAFKPEGHSPDVLKVVLAALPEAPPTPPATGGRRTALAQGTPNDAEAAKTAVKANLSKLMGLPGSQ